MLSTDSDWLSCPGLESAPGALLTDRGLNLRERARMLEDLADHVPAVVFQFYHRDDGTEGFHYLCPRAVRWFGSFRDWRRGRHVHADDRERLVASVDRAVDRVIPWLFEGRYVLMSGTVRWFQGVAQPHRIADEVVFNGVLIDIEERKRLEAERDRLARELREAIEESEAASRARDRFLATISHELRTPLTPVLLLAGTLARDASLPAQAREDITCIWQNAQHQERLIKDLLDVAAIRAEKLSVALRQTSLHEAIGAAVAVVQQNMARKGLRLEVSLEARRQQVMGDPERLCQVFWNILQNAAKFTPAGGWIRVRSVDDDDGMVRVDIVDNGKGMDAETLARAFQPFEQESRRAVHAYSGLGLGLAIAQSLVGAHHGTLTASSAGQGRGSTFTVRLPALP